MEKPVTVARREFIDALVSLVNESGLQTFVVIPILEDTLREIRRIDENLYEKELEAWKHANEQEVEVDNPIVVTEEEADDGRVFDDQGA